MKVCLANALLSTSQVCSFIDMRIHYSPRYSFGHYCLFTVPFAYSNILILIDNANMQRMANRIDLSSSNLFENVLSTTVTSRRNDDRDSIIQFLYEHFTKLNILTFLCSSLNVNNSLVKLRSVTKLIFDRSDTVSLVKVLQLFPNLVEIYVHVHTIYENAVNEGNDKAAFATFLAEKLQSSKSDYYGM